MTPTLHDLTQGRIDTLGDLTEAKIDALLGHTIEPGAKAPLFQPDGSPILDKDGQPLMLSYTHTAAFAAHMIEQCGGKGATTTDEVAALPIPFWKPTDILLISKDNNVIVAMRSNATRNAVGRCLTAAAGFPKIVDGRPESPDACARRELLEETGLKLPEIEETTKNMGIITQRPLQHYSIQTEDGQVLPGIVPSVVSTLAVRTRQTADELMKMMVPNHESAGFAVIPGAQMIDLERQEIPAARAQFYPSTLLASLSIDAKTADHPQALREALESPETAKSQPGQYALEAPRNVELGRDDFSHNGTHEALEKTARAVSAFRHIGPSGAGHSVSR